MWAELAGREVHDPVVDVEQVGVLVVVVQALEYRANVDDAAERVAGLVFGGPLAIR